ncbi:hypothetical protein BCU84_17920 [Shewanella sp. 10N.286.51.B7]|uniref:glycosyltransferase n=1 Tax=Shewanella sp. 10N.286.51.B7 TaxID=1880836 RepID=UPI000C82E36E|nr:glycosyltransferase [Shewanella sp. 10N.286.51.B7]PMG74831.1 hypothetical protein BCU84_17920 [Shewanella sp. 10N.286.51.B7]
MNDKIARVSLEHRFYSYKGHVYTKLAFSYSYWEDYLCFFDKVEVIARVLEVDNINEGFKRVDGINVSVLAMPYYLGVKSFIYKLPALVKQAYILVTAKDFFILRSGNVSNVLWLFIILFRKNYLREYPGNIYEGVTGFAGKGTHIKLLAIFLNILAKKQALSSKANSFVSVDCKRIYESTKPSYVFSSFNLDEIKTRKLNFEQNKVFTLISVGRLEGEKGHRDLIQSLALINTRVKLIIVGEGSQKVYLMDVVKGLDLDVNFVGAIVDREKLFQTIQKADLFVIPSHTEGMPRSLLEAMAIGLPCIGTNVGGIPEALESEYLVPANEPNKLAKLIEELTNDKDKRLSMAMRNLEFVKNRYSSKSMGKLKVDFWGELYK